MYTIGARSTGHHAASDLRTAIEEDIVTGRVAPGERLDEAGLAVRFGVSRTPVREALQGLAADGLITLRPRRGAVVASPTIPDLMALFEAMTELESACAGLAARRMEAPDHARLWDLWRACLPAVRAGDADAYYDANVRLHEAVYDGAGNPVLAGDTRRLRNRLAPYRRLQLRSPRRLLASHAEHEALAAAIEAGDEALARGRMRGHVGVQGEAFTDFLARLPDTLRAG